jgi:hypothetical protein
VTGGGEQLRVSNTSSAVNYVQVTGAATGGRPTISAQGSDTNAGLNISSKGSGSIFFRAGGSDRAQIDPTGVVNLAISASGGVGFKALAVGSQVNFLQSAGGVATNSPVLSAQGSDTNIAATFQSKGTGAINLAPGSSGVNISNGGTVTAITRTAFGSGYTSVPAIAISAPTTAGGVQAVLGVRMSNSSAVTITNGGTGYTVGNVLTVVGGTGAAIQITVSTVSAGVITAAAITNVGFYSALPTNPVSVTGGTGSGATFTLGTYYFGGAPIDNAGSGYVEQPTVTFSGGGGSGAAAYAVVGGGAVIRGLGGISNTSLLFSTPGGPAFSVADSGRTTVDYWEAIGSSGGVGLRVAGATANNNGIITSRGTGFISLQTNAFGSEALRATHTASAVNYVQVTGSATSPGASALGGILFTGSDAGINAAISSSNKYYKYWF